MIAFLNQRSGMTSGCADWLDRCDAVRRCVGAPIPWVLGTTAAKATDVRIVANSGSSGLCDDERRSYAPGHAERGRGRRAAGGFVRAVREGRRQRPFRPLVVSSNLTGLTRSNQT